MPVTVQHSPLPLHRPGDPNKRPKGILKNPSFSVASGPPSQPSPTSDAPLDPLSPPTLLTHLPTPEEFKELTLQNTLHNAGAHRRSSSSARRASLARRHSTGDEIDPSVRLKWDEANLYLAEQDRGTRMKITEPKTPYEHARDVPPDDDVNDDDVFIDPKFVNVDELDAVKNPKPARKHRESEIPGLELGEPEEDISLTEVIGDESARIIRGSSVSREGSHGSSNQKHVSVSEDSGQPSKDDEVPVGMPTKDAMEKHRLFEEQRKKHYEMKNVRPLLGHPEEVDEMDEDEEKIPPPLPHSSLPDRGVNGTR